MTHFDDLFWLVAVVEAGTLSAAAERHGVTGAAVSKRLRLLEERLSVRLLERNARRLRTTEAGEMYYRRGKRLLEAFTELEDSVSSTSELLCGTIRVNAPHSFGLQRLAAPVAAFMAEHPKVSIQLDLDDAYIDINECSYDVVIRVGRLSDSSVVARRITGTQLLCCASPSYLAKHGQPQHPRELAGHNCLIYHHSSVQSTWHFVQQSGEEGTEHSVNVSGTARSNNGHVLLEMAERGLGIVIQPCFIVEDALARGAVVPILGDYLATQVGVYALYPSRQYLPLKITRFIDYLKNEFATN